ncbi:MAG: hypothetical protein A2664_04000 [Candidatus Taylorbacteria bacterium RIFCSPHIGHO2_01_FULL_46_22b]|uniref:Uncharacterized protein n=1 Tax=Candidatus Taylorbacteria bacterium RIFCSPHIGHO2_01_FULL_46_22b TaxID=1802301 RepID=A0A1G2M1H2_9BACT|nr:MAG: hypothetical protein A2664_04000 [Candidatus Taylorbacteria bacterium RIFCSPHIGHO2_01_FULL_46_22b]
MWKKKKRGGCTRRKVAPVSLPAQRHGLSLALWFMSNSPVATDGLGVRSDTAKRCEPRIQKEPYQNIPEIQRGRSRSLATCPSFARRKPSLSVEVSGI